MNSTVCAKKVSDEFSDAFPDKPPLPAQHTPRPLDQAEERELQRDGKSPVSGINGLPTLKGNEMPRK